MWSLNYHDYHRIEPTIEFEFGYRTTFPKTSSAFDELVGEKFEKIKDKKESFYPQKQYKRKV